MLESTRGIAVCVTWIVTNVIPVGELYALLFWVLQQDCTQCLESPSGSPPRVRGWWLLVVLSSACIIAGRGMLYSCKKLYQAAMEATYMQPSVLDDQQSCFDSLCLHQLRVGISARGVAKHAGWLHVLACCASACCVALCLCCLRGSLWGLCCY